MDKKEVQEKAKELLNSKSKEKVTDAKKAKK